MRVEFRVMSMTWAADRRTWDDANEELEVWLNETLEQIACREHGVTPRGRVVGSYREPKFEIEACCREAANAAIEALMMPQD